jgi:hypothetical protein
MGTWYCDFPDCGARVNSAQFKYCDEHEILVATYREIAREEIEAAEKRKEEKDKN